MEKDQEEVIEPISARRKAEDRPGLDYVPRMRKLGPRPDESLIAFEKRMFMVEGVRKLWMKLWVKHEGNREACARETGISPRNMTHELRLVGLSVHLLDIMLWKKDPEE